MTDDKYSAKNVIGFKSMTVNVFKGDSELDKLERLLRAVQDEIDIIKAESEGSK